MNAFKKTLAVTTLALTVPMITSVATAAEVSGNVTLTTDYKFRGISQNDTSPAIQGGFDVAFENGIYVGTWASLVDFQDPDGSDADMELDYYVGYGGEITEEVTFDVGYLYYDYPSSDSTEFDFTGNRDLDYQEIYGSVSFSDFTLGAAYSDDYWLETGEFYYVYGDYSFSLPQEFSLDLHYGMNFFEFASGDSKAKDADQAFLGDDEDSYSDYSITLNKSYMGVDFSLSWIDTDLDKDECWGTDWCDSSVVFAISKSM
ncbi:MAG: TorF family putative porin [Porticoccus sp.]|nr:TorF family putative porin [Porticoccus sp.]